jgi:UDP-glucose 4-epimerase
MAVVVTGSSGFIGRRLVARLTESRVEVVAVSRTRGGANARSVVVADYAETPAAPGDVLVHLAESAQLGRAEASGEAHVRATAEGVRALAEKPFVRLVYASSGVVYGDRAETPRRPTDSPAAGGAYARGKLAAEGVVLARGGVVARLGNVIGPGMHEGTVVSDILDQLDRDGPLIVRDVGPVRDYVWVDDVADALAAMALGRAAGAFNVGSGRSVSVGELAKRALALAGQPDREVVGRGPASKSHLALDIAQTTEAFGWRPRTSLDDALRRLIAGRRPERAAS